MVINITTQILWFTSLVMLMKPQSLWMVLNVLTSFDSGAQMSTITTFFAKHLGLQVQHLNHKLNIEIDTLTRKWKRGRISTLLANRAVILKVGHIKTGSSTG